MDPAKFALPRGSRILVTGSNGYIGTHVVDQLLGLGYAVRGTVRTEKPWLNEFFHNKYGKDSFETVIISSFENKDEVERALDGVEGLIHLASDVSFNSDPNAVIPWVVKATKDLLEIAAQKGSVKRVVLASSSTAVYLTWPDPNERIITADSWNDAAVAAAWDENYPDEMKKPMIVYSASKTEGERQAWKWIEKNKPSFVFNSVLPCWNQGKILHEGVAGSTMGFVRQFLKGDTMAFMMPEQWRVDVEDTARLFVIGLLDPSVNSERIFAFGESKPWTDIIPILRDLRPNNTKIPDAPSDIPRDQTVVKPRERAESLLRNFYGQDGFIKVEKSLEKGIEGLE